MRRKLSIANKVHTMCYKNNCVKCACIRSFSGPYFSAFRLNIERYRIFLRIQYKCGKIQTRKTPNTDTFHAVNVMTFCDIHPLHTCYLVSFLFFHFLNFLKPFSRLCFPHCGLFFHWSSTNMTNMILFVPYLMFFVSVLHFYTLIYTT